jgi:hypothetical protein
MGSAANLLKHDVASILAARVDGFFEPKARTNFVLRVTITECGSSDSFAHLLTYAYSYRTNNMIPLLRNVGFGNLTRPRRVLVSKMRPVEGADDVFTLAIMTTFGQINYLVNVKMQTVETISAEYDADEFATMTSFRFIDLQSFSNNAGDTVTTGNDFTAIDLTGNDFTDVEDDNSLANEDDVDDTDDEDIDHSGLVSNSNPSGGHLVPGIWVPVL